MKNFKKIHAYTILTATTFLLLAANLHQNWLTFIDTVIYENVTAIHSPFLINFFSLITTFFSTAGVILLTLILMIFFYVKKRWMDYLFVLLAVSSSFVIESLLKLAFGKSRPLISLVEEPTFSFPSGHSTLSMVFFSLVIILFTDYFKTKLQKTVFVALNIISVFLIGFSRIFLQVHWFTDVIGGYLIGIFVVLSLFIIIKNKHFALINK
jgi:undecaprenyl-diphosphatase